MVEWEEHYSPAFRKFVLQHFAFLKDLHLVPIAANWKKSEGDFSLLPKKMGSENGIQVCFLVSLQGQQAPKSESVPTSLLPGELHSTSSHHSFELCLISICLMHPLASCACSIRRA